MLDIQYFPPGNLIKIAAANVCPPYIVFIDPNGAD